jgi:hypothetical protein
MGRTLREKPEARDPDRRARIEAEAARLHAEYHPVQQIADFDPENVRDAKQRSRVEDDMRLEESQVARADLERRNGMFSVFEPSQVRLAKRRVPIRSLKADR